MKEFADMTEDELRTFVDKAIRKLCNRSPTGVDDLHNLYAYLSSDKVSNTHINYRDRCLPILEDYIWSKMPPAPGTVIV